MAEEKNQKNNQSNQNQQNQQNQNKNFVESITDMEKDFAQWYTDVVTKAHLCMYASVKGCMVIEPYGYAIWENIMHTLDKMFKDTGVENVAMPMFIPESLLNKEKDHVEGFAPEVAWVTHGGNDLLEERLCVRPTSETLFCDYYSQVVKSYRDLPKLLNQWVSVVRWEKTTRPFLRSREFYWQEGHTAHKTEEDAKNRTIQMLNIYTDFVQNVLAIPVIQGKKTDKEKFAGAKETYTIEAMMHDGQALQSATSHNFGDGFARAFNIQYLDENNKLQYVHQTSWGLSTRIIGAIIMVHGDNSGLKLPPRIAPIQVRVIPIRTKDENCVNEAKKLFEEIKGHDIRCDIDLTDKTPGFKFSESEMKGIPLRVEIGPKDIENGQVVLVRRDTREKIVVKRDKVVEEIFKTLDLIHDSMFKAAKEHLDAKVKRVSNIDEMVEQIDKNKGFAIAHHCGDEACEKKLKDDKGISTRCIPFDQKMDGDKCVVCGKPAKYEVIFGRSY